MAPRRALVSLSVAIGLLCAAVPASAVPDVHGRVAEFRLAPGARAQSLVAGPDGNVWFGGLRHGPAGFTDLLGRITPAGEVTEFPLGTHSEYVGVADVAFGPEGNLWFALGGRTRIGRFTSTGAVTEYELPSGGSPSSIVAGLDGSLWFTEERARRIGRIAPSGQIAELAPLAGDLSPSPFGIAAGPDGALWVTVPARSEIARIGTDGSESRFPLPGRGLFPREIVAGPDGALWFSETKESAVGRITTAGQATQFPVPGGRQTYALANGPADLLWYSNGAGRIGSIAPNGATGAVGCIRSCRLPIAALTAGPEGKLWFAAGTGPGEGLDARGTVGTFAPPPLRARIVLPAEVRGRYALLAVRCEGGVAEQRCDGRLRLRARVPGSQRLARPELLAEHRFDIGLGVERRLALRLSGSAAEALAERGHLAVRVETDVTGGRRDGRGIVLRLP